MPHPSLLFPADQLSHHIRRNIYSAVKERRFLSHRFDSYAGMSFPDADADHLETCIAFFFWAFSV